MIQPDLVTLESEHSEPNQASSILAWLRTGNAITPMDALNQFGCMRLGARVFELRRQGHPIKANWKRLPSGKRVAEYSL